VFGDVLGRLVDDLIAAGVDGLAAPIFFENS